MLSEKDTCSPLARSADQGANMSSYQFVNTLAQCYAASEQSVQVASGPQANSQEYYGMNYPSCYSPNLAAHAQYGQYSLMMGTTGSGAGSGSTNNDFNTSQRSSANQSPPPTQLTCKYQEEAGTVRSGASPQDLSQVASSSGECQAAASAVVTSAVTTSSSETTCKNRTETLNLASSSSPKRKPDTENERRNDINTESTSGNCNSKGNSVLNNAQSKDGSGGSSERGKSGSNNPPHIYPWMKRVHLGQSKSNSSEN